MGVTRLLAVALCVALVCASLVSASPSLNGKQRRVGSAPHRCAYDEIMRQNNISLEDRPHVAIVPAPPAYRSIDANGAAVTAVVQADDWQPIRIGVFSNDLIMAGHYCANANASTTSPDYQGGHLPCTEEDILTTDKRNLLLQELLPAVIALHQQRLSVKPVTGAIKVAQFTDFCSTYSIPQTHRDVGVTGYDFLLYVAAGPNRIEGSAAWAMSCQYDTDGRPVVDVIDISPRYFSMNQVEIHAVAHEMLHALGFDYTIFQKKSMLSSQIIRGKPATYVVTSPNVVARAREQYGCDTLANMELEDQDPQINGNSHWEARNAKDEMMSAIEGVGYYTNLTIAAMEDTGFYKGNYTNAEFMSWGYQAGCGLLNNKCVIDGVSQEPSMFCTDTDTVRCTSDRLAIGYCDVDTFSFNLPTYFQYFADPTEGGTYKYVDYCPIIESYDNTPCLDGELSVMPGSVTGPDARCFDTLPNTAAEGSTDVSAICASVRCGTDSDSYQIKIKGASDYVTCTAGTVLQLNEISGAIFGNGTITCPPRPEVCRNDQPADTSSSSSAAISSSSQPQPIASSSSQPLSSSSTAAISSSSQPQPIASSSSQPLGSSSSTAAVSSSSQPQPIASSSSSGIINNTVFPDRSIHSPYSLAVLTAVALALCMVIV